MARLLSCLLLVLLLSSCDKLVSVEPVGEPVWVTAKAFTGSKPGYCYGCGLGYDGKYDCSLKFRYSCDCTYHADALIQTELYKYESGNVRSSEKVLEKKNDTECS